MKRRRALWYLATLLFGATTPFMVVGLLFLVLKVGPDVMSRMQVDAEDADEEGRELLTRSLDSAREKYRGDGTMPLVLAGDATVPGSGLEMQDLEGEHYLIANAIVPLADGRYEIVAVPLAGSYPVLYLRFTPDSDDAGEIMAKLAADH